jgi:hypothetical protein
MFKPPLFFIYNTQMASLERSNDALATMLDLNTEILEFIRTAELNTSRPEDLQVWIGRLGEYLRETKKVSGDMRIPNSYRLISVLRDLDIHNKIHRLVVELSRQKVPANEEGEFWTERWGSDLVGYINYLFRLFLELTDYRVDVPTWDYNNNHSWLL